VTCIENIKIEHNILVGKHERRRPSGRSRCKWEVILKWISKNYGLWMQTGLIWLRITA
jgi:hypothetical protein